MIAVVDDRPELSPVPFTPGTRWRLPVGHGTALDALDENLEVDRPEDGCGLSFIDLGRPIKSAGVPATRAEQPIE